MSQPNKIYVSEYKGKNAFDDDCHFVIITAAENAELAREHVKGTVGIDVYPIWLMNATYPTIYISDGTKPAAKQVQILSNNNFHVYKKYYDKKQS